MREPLRNILRSRLRSIVSPRLIASSIVATRVKLPVIRKKKAREISRKAEESRIDGNDPKGNALEPIEETLLR
jgi:hypothetical protein